jgi:putative flippase GtrA
MLAPLKYSRFSTVSNPSEAPAPQLGGNDVSTNGADDAEVQAGGVALVVAREVTVVGSSSNGATSTKVHKSRLHPIKWLVDGHWLGRWRTPLLLKLWRYGAGSIVAFVTSVIAVYACFSWLRLGAISSSTIGFFAGAIPNWILNRRWAWQKRGREGVGFETGMYVAVSFISWLASTAATKLAATEASHLTHVLKDLVVTGSYMLTIVVLTGVKYVAYDRWVFVDRSRSGARRSRHQVPSTTEQNRIP